MAKEVAAQKNHTLTAILLVITMLTNILSIVLGVLNTQSTGFFTSTLENLVEKYCTQNTPQLTVSVILFTLVYTFNTVGLGYLLYSLRIPPRSSPVLIQPTLIPNSLLIFWNIAYFSSIAWSFLYDREKLVICCGLQVLATICLWIMATISFRVTSRSLPQLEKQCQGMLWLVRILIQNEFCLFATWAVVTSNVGFASALIYHDSLGLSEAKLRGLVSVEDGSTISLAIMLCVVVVLFVVENFLFEKHFRYIFTTFPVFIIAFGGIAARLHIRKVHRNLMITLLGITLSTSAMIFKIIITGVRLGKESAEKPNKKEK